MRMKMVLVFVMCLAVWLMPGQPAKAGDSCPDIEVSCFCFWEVKTPGKTRVYYYPMKQFKEKAQSVSLGFKKNLCIPSRSKDAILASCMEHPYCRYCKQTAKGYEGATNPYMVFKLNMQGNYSDNPSKPCN